MEDDRLIKSQEELIREVLAADGWTPEQLAAWEQDDDKVLDFLISG